AARRILPGMNGLLVFAFGLNDCVIEDGTKLRVAPEQTAENTRALLGEASAWLPCLFVGPVPVDDSRLPPQLVPGRELRILNSQIERANGLLARAASEAEVPYLDLFTRLIAGAEWQGLMQQGDGVHPPDGGYELMARMVEGWASWQRLFRGEVRS
ncbi:MAG: GDSL-type esterase/lipase family protein, partial [Terriglobales bacterium]